jgi:hypothetical protein
MGDDNSRQKKGRRLLVAVGVNLLMGTPLIALVAA